MHRPVHFEIQVPDPARSRAFFESVFGWKFQRFPGPMEYWLASTGEGAEGINGGLMQSPDGQTRTVNTLKVPSVDEFTQKVTAAGGTVCVPKFAIPGVGYVAYCLDPCGALFGVYHDDTSAA